MITPYHYVFSGVVYPESAYLELGTPISIGYQNTSFDIAGTVHLTIFKNQVTVDFTTDNKVAEMLTLRNLMTDFVSLVVDAAAFSGVVGYEVELRSVRSVEEQTTQVFGADLPGLSIGSNELRSYDVQGLFTLSLRLPLFRRALSDFRDAIRHPIDTGFFCYRAIESVLNHLRDAHTLKSKVEAIQMLNTVLNLDLSCVDLLRDLGGEAARKGYYDYWAPALASNHSNA